MSRDSGRAARAHGAALEDAIDRYHAHLGLSRLAYVRRVSTPVTVLGPVKADPRGRRVFRAAFDGLQGVDFVGHTQTGVHVAVEAKSHAGDGSWDCGIDPSGACTGTGAIQPAQWAELQTVERCGGVAVVVLRAWGGEWHMTPSRIAEHVQRVGRRTVRPDEIDAFARRGLQWCA